MKKTSKKYREKNIDELKKESLRLREEIAKLNLTNQMKPAKDTNFLIKKRKELAVLLTVISEKEVYEKNPSR
jgi:ribosomal protein L29